MQIRLKLNADKLTLDDLVLIDDLSGGKVPARALRALISRLIVDESDNYPEPDEALKMAGRLTVEEMRQAFEALGGKVKELQAAAIPPQTGGD